MPERHIVVQRRMSASPRSVWALYADFPNLASHWSGLRATKATGSQTRGVGARRRVDLKPVGSMDETVTVWEEGRRIDRMLTATFTDMLASTDEAAQANG